MSRSAMLAIAGLLAVGSMAGAGELERVARFARLHDAAVFEVASDELKGGLTISGEKITLENGNFTASVATVGHAAFTMSGVSAQGRMPLDEAFFADPIKAAMENLLNGSKVGIAAFKNLQPASPDADVAIKDIQLTMSAKAVSGSLKAMVFKPEFKGHASFDRATKKMTLVLESVTLGGIAVPIDLTFYVVSQVLSYPFVTLAKPAVIIDLTPFLPNMILPNMILPNRGVVGSLP